MCMKATCCCFVFLIIQLIKQAGSLTSKTMINSSSIDRHVYSNYTKSMSNLHQPHLPSLDLKEFWLKKSYFNPPPGLAQTYASRNHIVGADVPNIQVLISQKRWLLLQAPRYSRGFFRKVNSGQMVNPFQVLLNILKSLIALTKIFGYFLFTSEMIFIRQREVCVWISSDLFSNQPDNPLENSSRGEKRLVLSFLEMLKQQIKQWEELGNIFTVEELIKTLEWQSKLRRGSLTAIQASREVFPHPYESGTSFEPHQLKFYSDKIKGCMSVQEIKGQSRMSYFKEDMSNSATIKDEEINMLQNKKKISKGLLYDSKNMKYSIYEDGKVQEVHQEVRKTKKKFNLTSTSSTIEKFSEKLCTTIGRRPLRVKKMQPEVNQEKVTHQRTESRVQTRTEVMHRSEAPSIANELDDLFAEDEGQGLEFGEEGNYERLQKIAQEIEQILIW